MRKFFMFMVRFRAKKTELIFGHGDNYDNIVSNSSDGNNNFPTIRGD